jgi:hypothetical protein
MKGGMIGRQNRSIAHISYTNSSNKFLNDNADWHQHSLHLDRRTQRLCSNISSSLIFSAILWDIYKSPSVTLSFFHVLNFIDVQVQVIYIYHLLHLLDIDFSYTSISYRRTSSSHYTSIIFSTVYSYLRVRVVLFCREQPSCRFYTSILCNRACLTV